MEYEIERFTRLCHATGRELAAGEPYYSVLVDEGAQLRRWDYSVDAWQGPPEGALGWWKSQRPGESSQRCVAPSEVLLSFFDQLETQPDKQDTRYVLALFLVRRRIMRLEETESDDQGQEQLVLYCPRRDATYRVPAVVPDESRIEQIQEQLLQLIS